MRLLPVLAALCFTYARFTKPVFPLNTMASQLFKCATPRIGVRIVPFGILPILLSVICGVALKLTSVVVTRVCPDNKTVKSKTDISETSFFI